MYVYTLSYLVHVGKAYLQMSNAWQFKESILYVKLMRSMNVVIMLVLSFMTLLRRYLHHQVL